VIGYASRLTSAAISLNVSEFYQLLWHYCFPLKKVQVQIAKGADVPQNAVRHKRFLGQSSFDISLIV
jgi:hypothetical protein